MKKFDQQLQAIFDKIERKIDFVPQLIAETAVEHFQNALIKKEWNGKAYQPYKNKKQEPSRGSLMMRTGNLFRTIRPTLVTPDRVVISAGSSRIPYARVHNEGETVHRQARTTIVTHKKFTRGKFKGKTLFARNNEKASFSQKASIGAYSYTMPQRQFMGKSPALLRDIKNRFKTNFKNL